MASYELSAFDRQFQAISLVGAIEQQSPFSLNVGYWLRDPNQWVEWPALVTSHPRQDFREQTCFEIFIGVQGEDFYREINLPFPQAWQGVVYLFEEYRYPEQIPTAAYDIELNQLKRMHYGLNVSLDLTEFMLKHKTEMDRFVYWAHCCAQKPVRVNSLFSCNIAVLPPIFTQARLATSVLTVINNSLN